MDQYDALRKMVFDGGRLVGVEEFRFESPAGFVMAFALAFENVKAHVIAMPEDDTVSISLDSPPSDPDSVVVSATDARPWLHVRGCDCTDAWLLTNEQGYTDGLRLEFRTELGSRVVEAIVAASQFFYHEIEIAA